MLAPYSSYSAFEIQSWWKDPKEARMEPPIQAPCLRSVELDEELILIFSYKEWEEEEEEG